MNLWRAYPYLCEACILLLLALAAFRVLPGHRRSLLLAALLLLPAVSIASCYVPDYWNPAVIARCIFSPEDVIWILSCGTTAWFIAILPFQRRITSPRPVARTVRSIAACYLAGGILFETANRTVLPRPEGTMPASLLVMLVAGVFFALRRPSEIPLGLAGGLGYGLFHVGDVRIGFLVWPHFKDAFVPGSQLPWELFGVPGWEVLWGACFGFTWPLLLAAVADIRLAPSQSPVSAWRGGPRTAAARLTSTRNAVGQPREARGWPMRRAEQLAVGSDC